MCGRFAQSIPLGKLKMIDLYDELEGNYTENYNLAPSQNAFIVCMYNGKRIFKSMKWGLVPSWTKAEKPVNGFINSRFESITEKPSFRNSYRSRRCIIPAAGFFEWKKNDKIKTPYFINRGKGEDGYFKPMLLCGIFDKWTNSAMEAVETFSIITRGADGEMKEIHERMPLILDEVNIPLWLGNKYSHDEHSGIIGSFDAAGLEIYPVSDFVNSCANNSAKCIEKLSV